MGERARDEMQLSEESQEAVEWRRRKKRKRSGPPRTTAFWRALSNSPGQADAISEWLKLGHLCLAQVHGSIEDERAFSAMGFIKNKTRNSQQHLNVAMRFFKQPWFTLDSFPYNKALDVWHDPAMKRGRYGKGD